MESKKSSGEFIQGVAGDIILAHLYLQEVREGYGDSMSELTPEGEFAIPDVITGLTTIKGEDVGFDDEYPKT